MPFVSCTTFNTSQAAQDAALIASQAAQDAAFAASQAAQDAATTAAIAAKTATGAAGGGLTGTYPNPSLSCPVVVACVAALPTGAAAVAGDLVLGADSQYHALPSGGGTFATPAQTIAGTATNLIVNPADLTAKLANQPAAGACTDREDVVWDGTILKGAAKHYHFSVSPPSIYFPVLAGVSVLAGTVATQSVTIANPSACRTLRVEFTSSAGASSPSISTTVGANVFSKVSVAGTDYLTNLGQEFSGTNIALSAFGVGILSKSFLDIAPGASVVVDYSILLSGTPLVFNQLGQIRAFMSYSAQTI